MPDGYRIVSQRQTVDFSAAGGFDDVMEVTAETDRGTPFKVRIPVRLYNEAEVLRQLDARAAGIIAVESL